MLSYSIAFFITAIAAALLGFVVFGGIVGEIAKILSVILLLLCVISVVASRHPPV